jgi:REP element-mobilizing transposase RayT
VRQTRVAAPRLNVTWWRYIVLGLTPQAEEYRRFAAKGQRMGSTLTKLYYHIVFSTKQREPLITAAFQDRLYRYIGGIAREYNVELLRVGGMPDHVHLVLRLKADVSVSEIVRVIKSNSSKWLNELSEFIGAFSWQRGYAAFTVSASQLDALYTYVENQAEHHRYKSFQEEYLAFLNAHQIE